MNYQATKMEQYSKPTILITDDDGIDAPGLRALVQVLVATNCYNVQVAAPDSYVVSGINLGRNCGYYIVYSGTVAGAREAFFNDIPSIVTSYDWVKGKSDLNEFTLAAQACLPIINAVLAEIKNQRYCERCFINIDLPTNVACHKGYKLTKQGKSCIYMGWKQVISVRQGQKMTSAMTVDIDTAAPTETDSSLSPEHLLFKREITVTPLAALSNVEVDCHAYYKDLLQKCL